MSECRLVGVRRAYNVLLVQFYCLPAPSTAREMNLLGARLCLVAKSLNPNFTIHLSHQIFCLMDEVLNIDK